MSAAEIMRELPKLTKAERRQVARKLIELAAKEESSANPEFARTMEIGKDIMRRYHNTLRELAK